MISSDTKNSKAGHDAACHSREEDYLNRWPLAKEVYRIAVDGPEEWSVRVGIYGEWGSGKTSVLNFIESMAEKDDHLVFHFNPWQYRNKNALWKAFVNGLFTKVEEAIGPVEGKTKRTAKKLSSNTAKVLPRVLSLWNGDAGKAAEEGINLLSKFLVFSEDDLKELKAALKGKRLIITIDDLDRADGDLVPEILYALKEIMDIPGMAFICAFDPVVVGKTLGKAHPGHDDGLKFLEKIIDYPRHLPAPSVEQLTLFAEAETQRVCPFVPSEHIKDIIPLLPANPRAIRQFVRILALLKPQIDRHYQVELKWPLILASSILKVRFPQLAYSILRDEKFWDQVEHVTLLHKKEDEEKEKTLDDKIASISKDFGLSELELVELKTSIDAIVSRISAWEGITVDSLKYQANLAETPHAVTWKEFDDFFQALDPLTPESILKWVEAHATKSEEPSERILQELTQSTIDRRKYHLSLASSSTTKKKLRLEMEDASKALVVTRYLLDSQPLLPLTQRTKYYNDLMDQFADYHSWSNEPKYRVARQEEKRFLKKLFDLDSSQWRVWLDVLAMYPWYSRRSDERPEWAKLENELRKKLKERWSLCFIESFTSQKDILKHIYRDEGHATQFKELLFEPEGPIWKKYRSRFLKQLKGNDPLLQENCYELLTTLCSTAEAHVKAAEAQLILSDMQLTEKLWKQCLSNPLNPRMVGSLRIIRETLQNQFKMTCPVPRWWERTCEELDRKKKKSTATPSN